MIKLSARERVLLAGATSAALIAGGLGGALSAQVVPSAATASTTQQECQEALGYPARTSADRSWLLQCVHAMTKPTPTTPPPGTGTASTPVGCAAHPAVCGYPDASNTGVPAGTALTYSAGLTASTAGATYTGLDIHGCVSIEASNVTIRNSRIVGGCSPVIAIRPYDHEVTGTVFDHIDVTQTTAGENGIAFRNYTLKGSHVRTAGDCGRIDGTTFIEDSFCEIIAGGAPDGPHYDGWQTEDGANNIVVRHNTVINPYSQTSALGLWTNGGGIVVADNLLIGGGYTLYCGGAASGFTIAGNRFVPGHWGPVAYCEAATWTRNIDDRTGNPI